MRTARVRGFGLLAMALVVVNLAGCSLLPQTGDDSTGSGSSPHPGETTSEQRPTGPVETKGVEPYSDALEAYAQTERDQIPTYFDALADTYSEMSVETEQPDTIVFTYTYKNQLDPTAAADLLDENLADLQSALDTGLFPAMETAGMRGTMKARYVYLNADGSELWSKTYESS